MSFRQRRVRALLVPAERFLTLIWRDRLPNELNSLLKSDRRIPARVTNLNAQRDVPQKLLILINLIDRLKYDFHSLNAVVFANLKAKEDGSFF